MAADSSIKDEILSKTCEHCGSTFTLTGKHRSSRSYFKKKRRFCSQECAASGSYEHRPMEERLLEFTQKDGSGGCWLWTGRTTKAGYGTFTFHDKETYAHRASYMLYNGEIAPGMEICHRCDNPACVNPEHLFSGTHADNMRDMFAKGREGKHRVRGIGHHQAKLSEDDVTRIRGETMTQRDIAAKYGISQATVNDIRLRKIWQHIP